MKVITSVIKFLVIAVCLLFIVFVIWKLYRDNINAQVTGANMYWPPEINKCPDYWVYKDDGKCHRNGQVRDPLTSNVTAEQLIAKCEEIKKASLPWEGVDNLC
jgi:hypothetical protein